MPDNTVTLQRFTCLRCDHAWTQRYPGQTPKTCPACKSPYWQKERERPRRTP